MKSIIAIACTAVLFTACADGPSAPADAAQTLSAALPEMSAATGPVAASAARITTDEDYYCTGTVTGTFQNVFVAEGASCTLTAAIVKGNILAKDRARLFVLETTTAGNIDGVAAAILQVRGGRLEGSIQAQDGQSAGEIGFRVYGGTVLTQGSITVQKMNTGSISITDAVLLKGNIQVQENTTGARLEVLRNRVAQNLEVFVNGGAGAKAVRDNTVSQKLSCKDNSLPFIGRPNRAGDVEGQCSR